MAKMIDDKPSFHGEAKTWESFQKLLPMEAIVYNNREINGREFDFCILWEGMGIFVVEVKGWLADKVTVLGVDNILVDGYDQPQKSPKKQARAYRFELLNKIVRKYNVSPIVMDLVCYPFISRQEYHEQHLDIVSENDFTLCKEDLENADMLTAKFCAAYNTARFIPHAELTRELVGKLRCAWEPAYVEEYMQVNKEEKQHYSVLSILLADTSQRTLEWIVSDYFTGTKRIVFVEDGQQFETLKNLFDAMFKKKNIQPDSNTLSIGYTEGLPSDAHSLKTFQLEVYWVPELKSVSKKEIEIEEGEYTEEEALVLKELSEKTSFNFQQYRVEHAPVEKNTLVEAGAGTGKTYSMVSRVAFLCGKKLEPISDLAEEIAMVTFTNDAAVNMKKRLKQLFVNYFVLTGKQEYLKFVDDADRANISTIHRYSIELLRNMPLYTGLGTDFKITSNEYQRGKIYDKYMNLFLEKQKEENENFVNEIAVAVYDLKKKLMNVADRLQDKSVDLAQIRKSELGVPTERTVPFFNDLIEQVLIPAETEYAAMLHKANGMDLKECIVMLNRVLEQLTGRIRFLKTRYLFVDEFQDTDDKQIQTFQRLQKAMPEKCRFFVVGDLKQSIYRFRGAKLSAFEQLKANSMFDWCIEHLTINYRTDGRLLRLYEPLLSKMGNEGFLPYQPELDCLTSDVQTGAKDTELFMEIPCHGKDQDRFFALCVDTILAQKQRIEELMKQHRMTSEERTIAVLVRKNWQVNKIASAAKEKGIDVEVQSGGDLFQRDSTMDLYRLVLALNNCRDSVCLVNLLESHFSDMQLDYQNLRGLQDDQRADALQAALNHLFSERMGKTWESVVNEIHARPVLYVLKKIYDAFQPWKTYQDQDEQRAYVANYEYLMELLVRNFRVDTLTLNQIAEYLRVNIVTRQERLAREDSIENAGVRILCTTVHKSKGLEYGTVILPYTGEEIGDIRMIKLDASYSESKLAYRVLFENQLREQNSNYDPRNEVDEQIAEETRVLYVALTRAIRNCIWMKDLDSCAAISWGSLLEG